MPRPRASVAVGLMCSVAAALLLGSWFYGSQWATGDRLASPTTPIDVAPTVPSSTTSARPTTTVPTTTSTMATTTTTRPPRIVLVSAGDAEVELSISSYGWVLPETVDGGRAVGADLASLVPFVQANDGPHGVSIDSDFLTENSTAPWLSEEGGIPVISGVDANGLCLNIMVPLILRHSYVSCPTRIQSSAWGYPGEVDDAPAVNIAPFTADGVTIEHNTITCSGSDGDICSRSVRIASRDAVVRFNDMSLARGAVGLFHDATFTHNYLHSFAFGFDPARAGNENDRITHNNAINNLGYTNVLVAGNYIEATYGRVSASPSEYLNPHFRDVYEAGVVEVGDPINGFAFTNYLINGAGDGVVYTRNYVTGTGRPFRCNASASHETSTCAADLSFNVFADLRLGQFGEIPAYEDKDGEGTIGGECNFEQVGTELSALLLPTEVADASCEERLVLAPNALDDFARAS